MEFIANLQRSQTLLGLTPENLEKLEKIFYDAVGDKKEIDIESFKKIVQSKNTFFAERMFSVFDADKSGSISLEEFMRVMRSFAKQSPAEKLRYVFDVYDINSDGVIELSELRSVISECMKENGLQFGEAETDELTRMLFEDADTDGNGAVTFAEFRNQLERQPAFMENLTLSIERWLLPPIDTKKRSRPRWSLLSFRKIRWRHIRNNWTSVVYLLLYFLVNIILFSTRAYEYRERNTYVILARACGQCLNFNCAFVVVLVLRQSLTWLRTNGFAKYFPIDQHLYYHKLTGIVILFYSVWHTAMHVANFHVISEKRNITLPELLTSTHLGIGWVGGSACLTGWILLFIIIVMCISSMPFVRRSGKFEVFYYLHLLYFVFWGCLFLHGPNFWKWFMGPAILYFIELVIRANRKISSSKVTYVQQGVLLPSKVTHLVIKRPPKFDYKPGDYVYINIPTIANFEWHPFTISSAPELDDVIWLHIRGVGEWTNSLYNYFQREDREAVLSDELVKKLNDQTNSLKSDSIVSRGFLHHSSCDDTPAGLDHPKNCSLLSARSVDNTYMYQSPNEVYISVPENHSSFGSEIKLQLNDSAFLNPSFYLENLNRTALELGKGNTYTNRDSTESAISNISASAPNWRKTSFTSFSTSRAIQQKNKEDIRNMLAEHSKLPPTAKEVGASKSGLSIKGRRPKKERRKSVRVSMAKQGLRSCQTVIVMPTDSGIDDDDEDEEVNMESEKVAHSSEDEIKDLKREEEVENIVVSHKPLRVFLDGPYGSPTRHIFQAKHAVLIATGIGVTPFASILQSVMYQYRKSKHTCPNCNHKWSDPVPVSNICLRKVDFFWLNRNQRCFEWFVNLLSELEVEQARLEERFLDIHMYITSALKRTDMKAVGLQMALDLLYKKEKRDLITGLKSRTQPGRPDWHKVFTSIAEQRKGKVTVFFCGPFELAKTLQTKCDEFGFRFRKENF